MTVRELLSSNGITLNAAQEQNLNLDAVIDQDMTLSADSVTYTTETEEQTIAYKTEYRNTDSLPEGESRVTQKMCIRDRCVIGHFDLVTKFNEGGCMFDESDPRYIGPVSYTHLRLRACFSEA